MDHAKQVSEMTTILNKAKRAGLKVYHYPDSQVAVIRIPAPIEELIPADEITPPAKPAAPLTSP